MRLQLVLQGQGAKNLLVMWRTSGTFHVESPSISKSVAMADSQTAIPVSMFQSDDEREPEEEDAHRNIPTSGGSSASIVKPPPLQLPGATDAGVSMQHPTNTKLVYPWLHTGSSAASTTTEPSMTVPMTLNITAVHSESGPWVREGVTTALLAGSPQNSKNNVRCGVESPLVYGTTVKMQRQHSILRMSVSKTSRSYGLRKSASVEFELDHAHQRAAQSIHASMSSVGREPRRLTFEEKAELYRVRPDLEIGPVPFYHEKVDELNRRNQRRIIFAMFGGMISIVLLLFFFSMWEYNN